MISNEVLSVPVDVTTSAAVFSHNIRQKKCALWEAL